MKLFFKWAFIWVKVNSCFTFASMEIRNITKVYDLWISHDESDIQDQEGDLLLKLIRPKLFITLYIPPHLLDTNLINPTEISLRWHYLLTRFHEENLEAHTMFMPFPTSFLVVMLLIQLWWSSLPPSTLTTCGTLLLMQLQNRERTRNA